MILSDISSKITSLTGADTNRYTNAERVIDLNIWLQNIVGMILDSQDETDWDDANRLDFPRKTVVLTTNRDYSFPVSEKILKFKSLSIAYDGVNFYRATPLEYSSTILAESTSTDTTQNSFIDSNFSRTAPRYDVKNNSVFIYPKATSTDVSNGGLMLMEWFREAIPFTETDLTASSSPTPGFDGTFHVMLAYGASYEYLKGKDMKRAETVFRDLQIYETRLRKQYSSKQLDRQAQLMSDYQSYK
jgi:hypothetical protein